MKSGWNTYGEQRYRCQNPECAVKTFMLKYRYTARQPNTKEQIIKMAVNGSCIRDIARVLNIHKNTVKRRV